MGSSGIDIGSVPAVALPLGYGRVGLSGAEVFASRRVAKTACRLDGLAGSTPPTQHNTLDI